MFQYEILSIATLIYWEFIRVKPCANYFTCTSHLMCKTVF